MRIHFELILNSVTPSQPQQRERGRTSPTQRCGVGTRGPERFCAAPSGGGHCRPRGVLRPAPSSSFARPGAAALRTRLRARKQDPGPPGLPDTSQVVVARARVRFPNGRPPRPALRALTLTSPLRHRKAPGTWSSGVDAAVLALDPARNLGT